MSSKRPNVRSEAPRADTRREVFAVAAPGAAPLVAAECMALGYTPLEVSDAGVTLSLTLAELFALNCHSRLASRVVVRLATFAARDFATLEKQSARVTWSSVLTPGMRVRLRVTCRKSRLYHSDAVAERVARGITNALPGLVVEGRARDDEDETSDDAAAVTSQLILVRIDRDQCTISADSSGALLHRRGWRQAVAKAPLRETLAALILAGMQWKGTEPLVDPFCGSGTIGIEAALFARRIAPGLHRSFAMEQWPHAATAEYARARDVARSMVLPSVAAPIVLRDRDGGAITAARANAERAGVATDVQIEQGALSDTDLASIGPRGVLLTNPPYGLRVSDGADLRGLFARLGDVVRGGGRQWQLGLFMPNDRALLGQLRLRTTSVLRTSNGGLPVELFATQRPA
ncbi:MAG: class I SAM-dependent RNA methyltransferase [Gemmatimonadaceae bacterium]|nr:class I SAM-dependent RNA methyltransferase [Gemmatimonadaceae bacterium]